MPHTLNEESAVSRALRLPEIVSAITGILFADLQEHDDLTLRNAMLVNSLWAQESCRQLWTFLGFSGHPDIKNLIEIDPSRRQKYADYIGVMTIADPSPLDELNRWRYSLLPQMAHISFPRLERLYIRGPGRPIIDEDSASESDEGPEQGSDTESPHPVDLPLAQFAQPSLTDLEIIWPPASMERYISDSLLLKIKSDARNLESLLLQIGFPCRSASPEAFASMVSGLKRFRRLVVRDDDGPWLSLIVLRALASHPSFEDLKIPRLPDSWLPTAAFEHDTQRLFQSLKGLQCSMSSRIMKLLVHHNVRLRSLDIRAEPGSTDMFSLIVAGGFSGLEYLEFEPCHDTLIHVVELESIARNNPGLRSLVLSPLYLASADQAFPIVKGLDDDRAEHILKLLPNLKNFGLHFVPADTAAPSLTHKTLLTLGRHCPELKTCQLSAFMDYEELVKEVPAVSWPKLDMLIIGRPGQRGEHLGEWPEEGQNPLQEAGAKLFRSMPLVGTFEFWDSQEFECAFRDAYLGY